MHRMGANENRELAEAPKDEVSLLGFMCEPCSGGLNA